MLNTFFYYINRCFLSETFPLLVVTPPAKHEDGLSPGNCTTPSPMFPGAWPEIVCHSSPRKVYPKSPPIISPGPPKSGRLRIGALVPDNEVGLDWRAYNKS
jgi:hypothetical protein